jgi:hypothetical protein
MRLVFRLRHARCDVTAARYLVLDGGTDSELVKIDTSGRMIERLTVERFLRTPWMRELANEYERGLRACARAFQVVTGPNPPCLIRSLEPTADLVAQLAREVDLALQGGPHVRAYKR